MKVQAILCYFNTLNEEGCFDFLRPAVCRDVKDILAFYREDPPVAIAALRPFWDRRSHKV